MPNEEIYNLKSNSAFNLVVFLLIATGLVVAGIIFLPQLVERYFSSDLSQVTITEPIILPKVGGEQIISRPDQLNSLQMPAGVPLGIADNMFGRNNPFAPF